MMRALATSIHVRTYLPKFNNEMHYYYDIIPRYHGDFFIVILLVLGQYDANLETMCCHVLCYQPLHTHVRRDLKNIGRVPFKITLFARFSLVSHSIHPRSRRGTERIRHGEGRWSRPPMTALERSDLTEKFQFSFKPCRRQ